MSPYFNDKLSLFLTEVSFETSEENQLSYFQNGYFFKIVWWSHQPHDKGIRKWKNKIISECFTINNHGFSFVSFSTDRTLQPINRTVKAQDNFWNWQTLLIKLLIVFDRSLTSKPNDRQQVECKKSYKFSAFGLKFASKSQCFRDSLFLT